MVNQGDEKTDAYHTKHAINSEQLPSPVKYTAPHGASEFGVIANFLQCLHVTSHLDLKGLESFELLGQFRCCGQLVS